MINTVFVSRKIITSLCYSHHLHLIRFSSENYVTSRGYVRYTLLSCICVSISVAKNDMVCVTIRDHKMHIYRYYSLETSTTTISGLTCILPVSLIQIRVSYGHSTLLKPCSCRRMRKYVDKISTKLTLFYNWKISN